jgi:hypothetical protein
LAKNILYGCNLGTRRSLAGLVPALVFALALGCAGRAPAADPPEALISGGTPVKLRLTQTVTSTHAHRGDRLNLEVVKDVTVNGFTVIRAGTPALGSVVKVKGRRLLGLGGEVVVQPDSVQLVTGDTVSLQGHREFNGGSHTKLMAEGMIITALIFHPAAPALLLTHGHECVVLKGSELTGTIEGDSRVPSARLEKATAGGPALGDLVSLLPPRVMNGDGREGDMMNLLFVAREDDFRRAFADAGWVETDNMKPTLFWHLLCQRKHYARLPMARLYAFGRRQDYSYSLPDPTGELTRRHHLRIWKTDYEVNGVPVWVGAATHDVALEFEKHHLWMTHRIDPDVDAERDFIAEDLKKTELVTHQEYVPSAIPVFEARTATGETYHSDSRILVLELSQSPALALAGEQPVARPSR